MSLFDKRVLVVTGKGGVGKTAVALALGQAAASRGLRTLVAEVAGGAQAPAVYGRPSQGYRGTPLGPGFTAMTITPEEALEDYLVGQLRFRSLYRLAFQNRVVGPFVAAVPGLHDLIQLGKIMDLERQHRPDGRGPTWDLIVVDAPATGHGLTMLDAPDSMMALTVAGPFYENSRLVRDLFRDGARTSLVLVTTPEELPVNETVELYERLGAYRAQVQLVVLNQVYAEPFAALERWPAAREHLLDHTRSRLAGSESVHAVALAEAVRWTDRHVARARRQRALDGRLAATLPVRLVRLPFLGSRALDADGVGRLARVLEAAS